MAFVETIVCDNCDRIIHRGNYLEVIKKSTSQLDMIIDNVYGVVLRNQGSSDIASGRTEYSYHYTTFCEKCYEKLLSLAKEIYDAKTHHSM